MLSWICEGNAANECWLSCWCFWANLSTFTTKVMFVYHFLSTLHSDPAPLHFLLLLLSSCVVTLDLINSVSAHWKLGWTTEICEIKLLQVIILVSDMQGEWEQAVGVSKITGLLVVSHCIRYTGYMRAWEEVSAHYCCQQCDSWTSRGSQSPPPLLAEVAEPHVNSNLDCIYSMSLLALFILWA